MTTPIFKAKDFVSVSVLLLEKQMNERLKNQQEYSASLYAKIEKLTLR